MLRVILTIQLDTCLGIMRLRKWLMTPQVAKSPIIGSEYVQIGNVGIGERRGWLRRVTSRHLKPYFLLL